MHLDWPSLKKENFQGNSINVNTKLPMPELPICHAELVLASQPSLSVDCMSTLSKSQLTCSQTGLLTIIAFSFPDSETSSG